jgi:hypothetical protein
MSSKISDAVPTLLIDTLGNSNAHPSLKIMNASTAAATKIVKIDSQSSELFTIDNAGEIVLTADDPKLIINSDTEAVIMLDYASSNYDGAMIIQNSGDLNIANAEPGKISQITGTHGATVDRYNIIRGECAGASNKPFVTILTDPEASAPAALASNDINFYVYGAPGSLGSAGVKKSALFGGDVQVLGCVARGGVLHLSNGGGTPQNYGIDDTEGYTTTLNEDWVESIIWNTSIITDSVFYSLSASGTDITILKAGVYKISYSVNFSQLLPATNRINMRTFLHDTSASSAVDAIDCSEAWTYGRGSGAGDTVSKITNTCTTTKLFAVDDEINLNMLFFHGARDVEVSVNIRANQAWILIEKIG